MCDFTTHTEWVYLRLRLKRTLFPTDHNSTAGWPNGKALDYESRDCSKNKIESWDNPIAVFLMCHSLYVSFPYADVAGCGVFLKDRLKAAHLKGAPKYTRDSKEIFDPPERYGIGVE
ncbi:unnamed protein product [Penicillium camemberti]|uniref:Str. FM013 n=1 Tax=Penicillium camemberti (strain FM 013) TaxID=1429867 RepID=A0A0G4PW36_PENC3|nr:unnamed protein product [Penicillium camemberti]